MKKLPLTIAAALVASAASTLPALADDFPPGPTPPCVAQTNSFLLPLLGPTGLVGPIRSALGEDNNTLGQLRAKAVQGSGIAQYLENHCNPD
jgi:hypothetical protein